MGCDARIVRRNGFEKPFEPLQILTWLVLAMLLASYYLIFVRMMKTTTRIILSVFYTIFSLGCVIYGGIACYVDPVDPLCLGSVSSKANNIESDCRSQMAYCFLCQQSVKIRSKHCRYCNKCVDTFDHHCIWLNNCIGLKNYKYFIALLVTLVCLSGLKCATGFAIIIILHYDLSDFKQRVENVFGKWNVIGYAVVIYVFTILSGIIFFVLLKFLVFHIRLIRSNATSYDFIARSQQRLYRSPSLPDERDEER